MLRQSSAQHWDLIMPLSTPAARERKHTRRIELNGFLREDGLWDIEAHLTDEKSYGFDNEWRGRVEPGAPVHDMWIRLTVDDDRVVKAVEVVTDVGPYSMCPDIAPNFQRLVGLKVGPGWNNRVKELVGGTQGCTHLGELLGPVATIVYQTQSPSLLRKKRGAAEAPKPEVPRRKPANLDTCHAYASDSDVVKRFHPAFYTGN